MRRCGRRKGCCYIEHGKSEKTDMTLTSLRQGHGFRTKMRDEGAARQILQRGRSIPKHGTGGEVTC